MTYISRRTRIIVSRWTDECDADYILRAVRKRSDGRFKRHSSCDDLRAWVNDYCIKHEHLVDLMSNGEFSGRPPFRLYGRFIPVPILFKLIQNLQSDDPNKAEKEQRETRNWFVGESALDKCTRMNSSDFLNRNENSKLDKSTSLSRIQWERNYLEKNLYDSTNLLDRALRTLERIDVIVDLAKDETENVRNEEIQLAFYESRAVCECEGKKSPFGEGKNSKVWDDSHSFRSCVKKIQDSTKCAELLRKISGLREKLKKIHDCRQKITRQIHKSQVRAAKCASSNQVTELFSFRQQSHIKKLKKKLEKLISKRGQLLSEMCDDLKSLNSLKKSSRVSLPTQKSSKLTGNMDVFKCGLTDSASCACGCNCSKASSEFDKFNSDSLSVESCCIECVNSSSKHTGTCDALSDSPRDCSPRTTCNWSSSRSSVSGTGHGNYEGYKSPCRYKEPKRKTSPGTRNIEEPCVIHPQGSEPRQTSSRQRKCIKNEKEQNTPKMKETKEVKRQSKVSFADENESPCRKKYYQDDLSTFEKSLTPEQQAVIQKTLKKIECRRSQLMSTGESQKRPTSSPTTRKERTSVSAERRRNGNYERRVKSETTMQEIEKTLRNYEQRLRNYDALEYKVEEIRQKISESIRMKQEWARQREEGNREMEAEREKSKKEITKLSSENRTLKKQMQQLMTKFEMQCKKIQNLKTISQKNWELECETEELKKELLKYQDTFERQRKCITKWESVVALQRTEIENLMNHIRRLTMPNGYLVECPTPEKKNVQRSRSYSPEIIKQKKVMKRPKTYARDFRSSSEEEGVSCYFEEREMQENSKRCQREGFNRGCYSPPPGRGMNW